MSEKEKMIKGEKYWSLDEELYNDRERAKEVFYEYNNLSPRESEKRRSILKNLLGHFGENAKIEQPFRCAYGYNISFGDYSYSNYNLTILDCGKVTIGNNVLIGPNVNLFTANHIIEPKQRRSCMEYTKPIVIEDGVWIGGGSTILSGVTIGENAVIGAGSVVTKDIPKNMIAVGNPCKVIKSIDEHKESIDI